MSAVGIGKPSSITLDSSCWSLCLIFELLKTWKVPLIKVLAVDSSPAARKTRVSAVRSLMDGFGSSIFASGCKAKSNRLGCCCLVNLGRLMTFRTKSWASYIRKYQPKKERRTCVNNCANSQCACEKLQQTLYSTLQEQGIARQDQ